MKTINQIISIFMLTLVTSCMGPKAISTIESNNYDEKTNLTTFTKFPFGSIGIPGNWKEISYNQVSRQHYYENADSVWTAIAINRASSYPFYKPNMSSNQIVKEFYEWESEYLVNSVQGKRTIIKEDTINHFILWQIEADNDKFKVNNHFLFGSENGIIFNLFVSTNKWTNEQKIEHLESLYKNKTVGDCCK